ncbi:MAG TPA: pyrroline-5-carboxylate reductase [Thermodesulfovibrionales bacterium]|nr:pyrroline-5-carboxylate reductase [Thermodesulfovibrionales bacterium]
MIGFVGGGNMAEALIKGMTSHGMRDILVSEPREERRKHLEESYGVMTTQLNKPVASSCSLIILAVKPQNMPAVLDEIAEVITEEKTVVSIAAGITLPFLQSKLKTKRLVRVMPNTPALVQEGMSVISLCECFSNSEMNIIREIFMSVGRVLTLPEKYMDAVTALSGSGPGFIAFFLETMRDAGVAMGLSREHAEELAVQTFVGTAKLLETGMPPEKLREMVTSPGGTTAAGVKTFQEKDLAGVVGAALGAAMRRAEELGRKE